jgi:hypothetical protein
MSEWFDKQGRPMSIEQWQAKGHGYRRIELDIVGPYRISTVWLGLNFQFGDGPPLIFETMVFKDGDNLDPERDCERYSTESDAIAGHAAMVAKYRGLP